MRNLLITGLFALFLLSQGETRAQTNGAESSRLMSDLCGCMSAIDVNADDRRVEQGVRDCLEYAVIAHPSEAYAMLQQAPPGGSKAFRLGSILGARLLRACEPFRVVKARLQQMPTRKQGS